MDTQRLAEAAATVMEKRGRMGIPDEILVTALLMRDGAQPTYVPHKIGEMCQYWTEYGAKGLICPWCVAQERRASEGRIE